MINAKIGIIWMKGCVCHANAREKRVRQNTLKVAIQMAAAFAMMVGKE